jgi:DNA/RNA endonuclease YhcR with UshA esterase domain
MVLVNLGAAYPNQLLTLALKGDAKSLSSGIDGKTVTITGQVIDYKGKPEIILTDPAMLIVK